MKKSYSQLHLVAALAVGLFIGAMGVVSANSSQLLFGDINMSKVSKPVFEQQKPDNLPKFNVTPNGKQGNVPKMDPNANGNLPPKTGNSNSSACESMLKERVEKMYLILQKAPWVQQKNPGNVETPSQSIPQSDNVSN